MATKKVEDKDETVKASSLLSALRPDTTMDEIIRIVREYDGSGTVRDNITNIGASSARIFGLMALRNYTSKPEIFFDHLGKLHWYTVGTALYRTVTLDRKNTNSPDYFLAKKFERFPESQTINGFPFYVEKTDDKLTIYYNRISHRSYFNQIEQNVFTEYERQVLNTKYMVFSSTMNNGKAVGSYSIQNYNPLFPSSNYLMTEEILENHVNTSRLGEQYSPAVLLIDSQPGFGKTLLSMYMAGTKIFTHIYKIDMNKNTGLSPEEIFKIGFTDVPINGATLMVFDEMDKYFEHYTTFGFETLRKNTKKGEDMLTKEEYVVLEKKKFLNLLLSVIERDDHSHPLVIAFCSNNFNTIYGDMDMTHYESLKTRFISVDFQPCDRQEVCDYLTFYNKRYEGSKYHVEEPAFTLLLDRLPADLTISFRALNHLSILNSNNIEKIITALENLKPNLVSGKVEKLNLRTFKILQATASNGASSSDYCPPDPDAELDVAGVLKKTVN